MDWHSWHDDYDVPNSPLARRLQVVQERIEAALDTSPSGPIRIVSVCAGQGRDVLGVLARHPRGKDAAVRLVELDPQNADSARRLAETTGLNQVEVVVGDAALTNHYDGMVPADVVLICGVFGNISDEDIHRTVEFSAQLCRRGATLVWTRHRRSPDLVPTICQWFEGHSFEKIWLSDSEAGFGVGAHRFVGEPQPLALGGTMFTFLVRQ